MESASAGNYNTKPFNRFDIPVKMGLLIAIVKIVLSTVQYQFFLSSWGMTMLLSTLSFLAGVFLLYLTGKQQRDALGGYITIREAFSAIFIAILVTVTLNFIYDWVYITYIDPSMLEKIRESSISAAEGWGAPQEQLDKMAEQFDEQEKEKGKISSQLVSFFSQIVLYSIVGFIIAAIVKKNKPVFEA